jgi:hypothetical protein
MLKVYCQTKGCKILISFPLFRSPEYKKPHLLKEDYGEERLRPVDPGDAIDGIELTRDELFHYHKLGKI